MSRSRERTAQGRRRWLRQVGAALLGASPAARAAPRPARQAGWPAWESFRKRFVSDGGRVVDLGSERSRTVSEGQAYALFFALVANDPGPFAKVLRWTEDNLCGGDMTARLPAWLWGRGDGERWGVLDGNSASDADLWIAYALAEAGRLWSEPRYEALSATLCGRILREECAELPGLGLSLLPGREGFARPPDRWRLNPSYLPPQVLARLAGIPGPRQAAWQAVERSALESLLGCARGGWMPDWIVWDAGRGWVAHEDLAGARLETAPGSYDAIRVYLWVGMLHPASARRNALLATLAPMVRRVQRDGQPPEAVDTLTGQSAQAGPPGFSAAVLPLLRSSGDAATLGLQLQRLRAHPPPEDAYYQQALTLFGLGWQEGWYRFDAAGRLQLRWRSA